MPPAKAEAAKPVDAEAADGHGADLILQFSRDQHHLNSSLREIIIEHLFVGELLRSLWSNGVTDCEVLRSEFDGFGYDLVISRAGLTRHVQMKSGTRAPSRLSVNLDLAKAPSGCVVFIVVSDKLEFKRFFWFGAKSGLPLPDLTTYEVAKRPTHNKDGIRPMRQNHRVLKKSDFQEFSTFSELVSELV